MAVTSNRRVINEFSGDYDLTAVDSATENDTSPGSITSTDLSLGNNTITVPTDAIAVTMLFPSANTVVVTLKGVNGDTGIDLHLTDPTSIGLHSVSSFVLSAASVLAGVKFIWS